MRLARITMGVVLGAGAGGVASAQDKPDHPRVIAAAPLGVFPGQETALHLRGAKLVNATELQFREAPAGVAAEIKEKKPAEIPKGLDPKDVGDTQMEVKLVIPPDLPVGCLTFSVVTPEGSTAPCELRVLNAAQSLDEIEPNGGLREGQSLPFGKTLRGVIKEDKDVDVFLLQGKAGQRFSAEIFAAQGASLLDPLLTLYNTSGFPLASDDDTTLRDSRLAFQFPADGIYLLTVQDAHDRGGAGYAYLLNVKEVL